MHDSYSPRQRRRTHLDVDHCAVHVQTTTGDNDHDDYDAIALLAQQESPEKSKRRRTMQTLPLTLRLLVQRITGNKPTSIGVLMAAVALFVVSQLDLFAATPVNTTATTTHYRSWSFASSWTTALHSPTVGPPVAFSPRVARRLDTSLLRPDATKPLREPMLTDLGGLDLMTLHHTALKFCRVIDPRDATILQAERSALFEDIDDDEVNEHYDHTDEVTGQKECVRNNWGHRPRPVCNHFHESTVSFESSASQVQRYDINYLSHGYYRDSWLYKSKDQLAATTTTADTQDDDFFIFKTLRMHEDHEFNYYSLRKVEKEALVMEALSASHLIVDIYGHCATSIIAEAMPGEITTAIVPGDVDDYDRGHVKQSDLDALQQDDVYPLNNLTVTEKLDYAVLMAEAVAELHGYEGGVIVHGDLHPDQYLKAADGRIKLNDFNNGHLLLYSVENQTYCRFSSSYGGGYKAPEEFTGDYSNESVDTWAIGHGIFGLLTGLYPYYRTFSHSTIRKMVIEGRKPFVDDRYRNRSMVESRLVEIMEHCWEYEVSTAAGLLRLCVCFLLAY